MALALAVRCECGREYSVYIPKARILAAIRGDKALPEEIKQAEKLDFQEQQAGKVEWVRHIAERDGITFVDSRDVQVIICRCGREIEVTAEAIVYQQNSSC